MTLPLPDFTSIVRRLMDAIPTLTYRSAEWGPHRVALHFDPHCGGLIERHWPDVFHLCAECECNALFEWEDGLVTRVVLDTVSAAPDYETVPVNKAVLTITANEGVRRGEVAA